MVVGTYHYMSPKHLQRYLDEFAARRNTRRQPTGLGAVAAAMLGEHLTWDDLTGRIYPARLALW